MATTLAPPPYRRLKPFAPARYLALGVLCGVILMKSEIASWYRIQEMLRFQGFHMFGFFFSAVATAALAVWVLNRYRLRTLGGEAITVPPKDWGRGHRYVLGGLLFGIGWGLLSACPGPIYALIGAGESVLLVALLSALIGTWAYGWLRPRLPH